MTLSLPLVLSWWHVRPSFSSSPTSFTESPAFSQLVPASSTSSHVCTPGRFFFPAATLSNGLQPPKKSPCRVQAAKVLLSSHIYVICCNEWILFVHWSLLIEIYYFKLLWHLRRLIEINANEKNHWRYSRYYQEITEVCAWRPFLVYFVSCF